MSSGTVPDGLSADEWRDALDHAWHCPARDWKQALCYLQDPLARPANRASALAQYLRTAIAHEGHVQLPLSQSMASALVQRFEDLAATADFVPPGPWHGAVSADVLSLRHLYHKLVTYLPPPLRTSRLVRWATPDVVFSREQIAPGRLARALVQVVTVGLQASVVGYLLAGQWAPGDGLLVERADRSPRR